MQQEILQALSFIEEGKGFRTVLVPCGVNFESMKQWKGPRNDHKYIFDLA